MTLLSADAVVAGYVPGLAIVQGVSVTAAAGEIVSIIGPNGAGKSTLLKAIAGLVPREAGRIALGGRDVSALATHELIRAGIAFVPQTGNIFASLTIAENLVLGGHALGKELRPRMQAAYARFPILHARRHAQGGALSGGERQMLAIARALMTAPAVLMLDEPTAGLSPKMVQTVFADLRRLAQDGLAVLMVEQNARAALRISDRAYVLAEGRNRMQGRALDLLEDDDVGAAFLGGRA